MDNVNFERIEDYINGNMSKEERASFEADMASDKNMASAFSLYSSIEQTMRRKQQENSNEDDLRQTLKGLGALYFNIEPGAETKHSYDVLPPVAQLDNVDNSNHRIEKELYKARVVRLWAKVAVAVSIVGVIALCAIWFFNKKGVGPEAANDTNSSTAVTNLQEKKDSSSLANIPDTVTLNLPVTAEKTDTQKDVLPALTKAKREALFAQHFSPDAPPQNHDEFLNEAIVAYTQGNYPKAIAEFEYVASTPTTRGETPEETLTIFQAQYYQALSYLAMGNTMKAIAGLKRISTNSVLARIKVEWYLALAYLKAGQQKDAIKLFAKLAQSKTANQYSQKAQNLLEALEKK